MTVDPMRLAIALNAMLLLGMLLGVVGAWAWERQR